MAEILRLPPRPEPDPEDLDPASHAVLKAMALALARQLGREAAREYLAEVEDVSGASGGADE